MLKKYLTILLFLIIALGAVSAVSAEDISDSANAISDGGSINDNIVSEGINGESAINEEIVNADSSEDTKAIADDDNEKSGDEDNSAEINVKENDKGVLSANNENQATITQSKTDETPAVGNANEEVTSNTTWRTFKIIYLGQSGKYVTNKKIKFKVVDAKTGEPIRCEIWYDVYRSGHHEFYSTVNTNSKGIGYIKFSSLGIDHIGTFNLRLSLYNYDDSKYGIYVKCDDIKVKNVKVVKQSVKISPVKLNTYYTSGKAFKIKVLDGNKKAVPYVNIKLRVYTGKKYKTVKLTTNSKGIAQYTPASKLNLGKHKVKISINDPRFSGKAVSSYINIRKNIRITVRSAKAIQYDKNKKKQIIGGLLEIGIKDNGYGFGINGVPITLKIKDGKKYKTIKLVTGNDPDEEIFKEGYAGYATNMLSAGTHKVKIIVNSKKYKGTAYAKIVIPKSSKQFRKWYVKLSKGKETFKAY